MARTPIVRQKVATNPSSKAKTGKHSTSKHNPSDSKSKKTVPASAKDKRKEVDINYYDIDFNDDAKFKEKYEMLFRRGVVATKYCDIDTLKTLRIEEDVRWLFDNIGLENLLMNKTPTSMRATLEFLSSLKVHMFPNPSSGGSSITFRLFNEDHTWTLEKFNGALGIPIGGPRVTPQHWNEKELWRTISAELDYDPKRSSVTSIRHPALRYVFKVFSNTIFGRQEGSKVRKDEIFMLHHMLHATPIDTGAFLIHQLQSTANNVNTGGKIVQGGFITRIATYLGHREQLIRDGFVDGTDAVEVPPSWFKKKDGTTLWRIQNDEDEIPSPE
ncbi:Thiazole synthase [Bienertia sinuspersici]